MKWQQESSGDSDGEGDGETALLSQGASDEEKLLVGKPTMPAEPEKGLGRYLNNFLVILNLIWTLGLVIATSTYFIPQAGTTSPNTVLRKASAPCRSKPFLTFPIQ